MRALITIVLLAGLAGCGPSPARQELIDQEMAAYQRKLDRIAPTQPVSEEEAKLRMLEYEFSQSPQGRALDARNWALETHIKLLELQNEIAVWSRP